MEYQLQLKPFEGKQGQKYKVIQLTDIAPHPNNVRPTKNVAGKLKEGFETGEPGRIFTKFEEGKFPDPAAFIDKLSRDPEMVKMIQEEEKKGYKVLLSLPKKGIPFKVGKDTTDFIESKKGQRILRKLAKDDEKK